MKFTFKKQVKFGLEVFIASALFMGEELEQASHLSEAAARVWCLKCADKYAQVIVM